MIELIVVVSIVGILMAIGVPSYRYVTNSNRVSSEVNSLLLDMQFARSEALKEGRTVTVCPSDDGTSCKANSVNWHIGWIVFMDINNNAKVDDPKDEAVLRTQAAFGGADTFLSDNNKLTSVTFNREGFASNVPVTAAGWVTVLLHDSTSNQTWTRCLQITTVGMLTTQRYGKDDCK